MVPLRVTLRALCTDGGALDIISSEVVITGNMHLSNNEAKGNGGEAPYARSMIVYRVQRFLRRARVVTPHDWKNIRVMAVLDNVVLAR